MDRIKFTRNTATAFVVIAALLLTGCGISQEQYDAVSDNLSRVQSDIENTRTAITAAESAIADIKLKIQEHETEIPPIEEELTKTVYSNESLDSDIEDYNEKIEGVTTEISELDIRQTELLLRLPPCEYLIYEGTKTGFTIQYPETWTINEATDGGTTRYVFEASDSDTAITLSIDDAGGKDYRDLCDEYIESLRSLHGDNLLYIGDTVNAIPATLYTLAGQIFYSIEENGAYATAFLTFITEENDLAWTLTMTCDWENFPHTAYIFQEILDSFSINP